MTAEPAPDLIRMLEESRLELQNAVSGLTEAQASAAPESGGWSVLHCVEHIVFGEQRFLLRLEQAARPETPPESRAVELERMTANRTRKVQAPELAHPKGRFASLSEAMAAFQNARARSLQMAAERAADLPLLAVEHPFFGIVNGVSMMAVIAGHTRRHAGQIREIRAAL